MLSEIGKQKQDHCYLRCKERGETRKCTYLYLLVLEEKYERKNKLETNVCGETAQEGWG